MIIHRKVMYIVTKKVRMTQHAHTNPVMLMKLNPLSQVQALYLYVCAEHFVCSSYLFVACKVTVAGKLKV